MAPRHTTNSTRAPRPRSEHRRLISGAAALGCSHAGVQACGFLRNVILTHALGVDDFGVASAFAAMILGLEMMSTLSIDRLIVQSPRGDDPSYTGTLHVVMLVRAVILALAIVIFGGVLANMLGVPDVGNAFRGLALVPLLRGAMNLHIIRLHRSLVFTRSALVEVIPQVITLAIAWPLAWWLQSYWAVWWLLVGRALLSLLLSHLLAPDRWALHWNRDDAIAALRFGWPLLVNGLLMAMVFHADKLVVGSTCSTSVLASYAIAGLITSIPALLLTRAVGTALFPALTSVQDDAQRFRDRTRVTLIFHALMAVIMVVTMSMIGGACVRLIFGERYALAATFVPWFAAAEAARMFRIGAVQAALARGDSTTPLLSNLTRAPALFIQIPIAVMTQSPVAVLIIAVLAEIPSIMVAIRSLVRRHHCMPRDVMPAVTMTLLAIIVGMSLPLTTRWIEADGLRWTVVGSMIIVLTATIAIIMPSKDRRRLRTMARALRPMSLSFRPRHDDSSGPIIAAIAPAGSRKMQKR